MTWFAAIAACFLCAVALVTRAQRIEALGLNVPIWMRATIGLLTVALLVGFALPTFAPEAFPHLAS